jgi:transcriptional regulator with XRE-family HTH domain
MKLVEVRADRLLTVRELARKAGVEPRTIYTIEKGLTVPTLATVRKLSEALEIDPKEVDEFRAAIERTIQGREGD